MLHVVFILFIERGCFDAENISYIINHKNYKNVNFILEIWFLVTIIAVSSCSQPYNFDFSVTINYEWVAKKRIVKNIINVCK